MHKDEWDEPWNWDFEREGLWIPKDNKRKVKNMDAAIKAVVKKLENKHGKDRKDTPRQVRP